MAFTYNGQEVRAIVYNGQPVERLMLDGVLVWTSTPQIEIINQFPITEPVDPVVGSIWFDDAETMPKWWDGSKWNKGY